MEVKAYEIKRIAACFAVVLPKVSCLFFFFLQNWCSSKMSSWAFHSNMKHKQWCIIVCRSTAEYFQGSCSKVGGSCLGLSQRPLWYCSEQTQEARSMGCKAIHFVSPHRSFCLFVSPQLQCYTFVALKAWIKMSSNIKPGSTRKTHFS